ADFLKKNGGKIVSILFTDFNLDDAKEVWREEAREEGLEEGMEKGIERGREEGMEQGLKTKAVTIAKKLLGRNYPIADIVEDTGLTYAEINQLIAEG
ncbi:MAG: hypothetical protein FWG63_00465, partial [Defluviitaleaceae bacterium]|nr:hypothetical protein [Defluviitaleaceae bacterium]